MKSLVFLIALIPFSVAWHGYVLSCLWSWFIEKWIGLGPMPFLAACGISLVVVLFRKNSKIEKDKYDDAIAEAAGNAIVGPLLILAVGFAFKTMVAP